MPVDVGSVYPAALHVADANGIAANPSAATLTITLPDRTTVSPTVTLPPTVTGLLVVNYQLAQEGLHKFAWSTTSPTLAKTDYVSARQYASLISLDEARQYLGLLDTSRDELLRGALGAATRATEKIVGTCVVRDFTDDWIPGYARPSLRMPHGPLLSASSVTQIKSVYQVIGGPVWTTSQLIVNPVASTVYQASLLDFYYGPWLATYTAGRAVIPENIEQGFREILWDLWIPMRNLTGDSDIPAIGDEIGYEASLSAALVPSGYRAPARAMMFFGGDAQPGFA